MAGETTYKVVPIQGVKKSVNRSLAFLVDSGGQLGAEAAFNSLTDNKEREVRDRMDHWVDGGHNDKYFHGWPSMPKYRHCFTFKFKLKRAHQRLYGFLYWPKPKTAPRFEICVLAIHASKAGDTNFTLLDQTNRLRADAGVVSAIGLTYPEEKEKKK